MALFNSETPLNWDKCTIEGSTELMHLLARGQRMTWRNVNDELPKVNDNFITLIESNNKYHIEIAPWRNGTYQGARHMMCALGMETVTHWMPLPELPKGGEK